MATKSLKLFLLTLFLTISLSHSAKPGITFSKSLDPKKSGLKREKLTHLKFYFHDIVSGRNPTAVPVARAEMTNTSRSAFGLVVMMDDPLTVGPNLTSKLVGRAQGIYASASQSELSFLMVLNFAFKEGRNNPFSGVREMPVVGGSGAFRFARGYAQARTHWIDLKSGDAVVEYNVYVFHY
ncbi:Dirigent protein 7 [Linum perenne]